MTPTTPLNMSPLPSPPRPTPPTPGPHADPLLPTSYDDELLAPDATRAAGNSPQALPGSLHTSVNGGIAPGELLAGVFGPLGRQDDAPSRSSSPGSPLGRGRARAGRLGGGAGCERELSRLGSANRRVTPLHGSWMPGAAAPGAAAGTGWVGAGGAGAMPHSPGLAHRRSPTSARGEAEAINGQGDQDLAAKPGSPSHPGSTPAAVAAAAAASAASGAGAGTISQGECPGTPGSPGSGPPAIGPARGMDRLPPLAKPSGGVAKSGSVRGPEAGGGGGLAGFFRDKVLGAGAGADAPEAAARKLAERQRAEAAALTAEVRRRKARARTGAAARRLLREDSGRDTSGRSDGSGSGRGGKEHHGQASALRGKGNGGDATAAAGKGGVPSIRAEGAAGEGQRHGHGHGLGAGGGAVLMPSSSGSSRGAGGSGAIGGGISGISRISSGVGGAVSPASLSREGSGRTASGAPDPRAMAKQSGSPKKAIRRVAGVHAGVAAVPAADWDRRATAAAGGAGAGAGAGGGEVAGGAAVGVGQQSASGSPSGSAPGAAAGAAAAAFVGAGLRGASPPSPLGPGIQQGLGSLAAAPSSSSLATRQGAAGGADRIGSPAGAGPQIGSPHPSSQGLVMAWGGSGQPSSSRHGWGAGAPPSPRGVDLQTLDSRGRLGGEGAGEEEGQVLQGQRGRSMRHRAGAPSRRQQQEHIIECDDDEEEEGGL